MVRIAVSLSVSVQIVVALFVVSVGVGYSAYAAEKKKDSVAKVKDAKAGGKDAKKSTGGEDKAVAKAAKKGKDTEAKADAKGAKKGKAGEDKEDAKSVKKGVAKAAEAAAVKPKTKEELALEAKVKAEVEAKLKAEAELKAKVLAELKAEEEAKAKERAAREYAAKALDRSFWREVTKEEISAGIAAGQITKESMTTLVGNFGETPLHLLVAWNKDPEGVALVLELFEEGELGYPDKKKNELIHYAVSNNSNPDVVRVLLAKRPAAVYRQQLTLDPPINLAAATNTSGMVDALVEFKATVDARNKSNNTAFHLSTLNNTSDVVLYALQSAGFNELSRNPQQLTPLHIAAIVNQDPEYTKAMISAGGDILSRNAKLQTPLHLAVRDNPSAEVTKVLLDAGAQVNSRDADGNSPFLLAVKHNPDPLLIYSLINADADFKIWNRRGLDVFDIAKMEYPDGRLHKYLVACSTALDKQRPCLPMKDIRLAPNNHIQVRTVNNILHQNRTLITQELFINGALLQLYKFPRDTLTDSARSQIDDWNKIKFTLSRKKEIKKLTVAYSTMEESIVVELTRATTQLLTSLKSISPEKAETPDKAFESIDGDLESVIDDCSLYYCNAVRMLIALREMQDSVRVDGSSKRKAPVKKEEDQVASNESLIADLQKNQTETEDEEECVVVGGEQPPGSPEEGEKKGAKDGAAKGKDAKGAKDAKAKGKGAKDAKAKGAKDAKAKGKDAKGAKDAKAKDGAVKEGEAKDGEAEETVVCVPKKKEVVEEEVVEKTSEQIKAEALAEAAAAEEAAAKAAEEARIAAEKGTAHLYTEDYRELVDSIGAFYHHRFRLAEDYNKDFAIDKLRPPPFEEVDLMMQKMFASIGLELYQDLLRFTNYNEELVAVMRKRPDWLVALYPDTIQPELLQY